MHIVWTGLFCLILIRLWLMNRWSNSNHEENDKLLKAIRVEGKHPTVISSPEKQQGSNLYSILVSQTQQYSLSICGTGVDGAWRMCDTETGRVFYLTGQVKEYFDLLLFKRETQRERLEDMLHGRRRTINWN